MKPKMVFSFMDKCALFKANHVDSLFLASIALTLIIASRDASAGQCQDFLTQCQNAYAGSNIKCVILEHKPVIRSDGNYQCRAVLTYFDGGGIYGNYGPGSWTDNSNGCECISNTQATLQSPTPKTYPKNSCGSIIHNDNQAVGESVQVAGTPFDLVYFSDRVSGRTGSYSVIVPNYSGFLGGGATIFGKTVTGTSLGSAGTRFTWDGTDSTGKMTPGQGLLHLDIESQYNSTTDFINWLSCGSGCGVISAQHYFYDIPVGTHKAITAGLGGWTFSVHHFYDPVAKTISFGNGTTRSVTARLTDNGTHYIAGNEDGSLLFVFDLQGYHLKTLNGLTGATIYTFNYDAQNYLQSIVDAYGNTTSVVRNSSGVLTGIQAPFGQTTSLTLDSNGYLASIQNPQGETYLMTYVDQGGLLQTFKKPVGQISTFTYTDAGTLQIDSSSAGNSTTLSLPTNSNPYTQLFSNTSTLGVQSNFNIYSSGDVTSRLQSFADGSSESSNYTNNSVLEIIENGVAGRHFDYVPDARLGAIANFTSSASEFHYIYQSTTNATQTLTGYTPSSDPNNTNFFTYTSIDTKKTVNSNLWDELFTLSNKTSVLTSPVGRAYTSVTDSQGKLLSASLGSFAPITLDYDTNGRLSHINQSARTSTIAYNTQGYVDHVTNALNQSTYYTYDGAGRVLTQKLPDLRIISYEYDLNGNLTGVTPPGMSKHSMPANNFDLISGYVPPAVGGTSTNTTYTYNNDRKLTQILRPDGSTITYSYGPTTGVLSSITHSGGTNQYTITKGLLTSATSSDAITLNRNYSGFMLRMDSLLNSQTNASLGSVSFSYDNNLWLTNSTVTDASGSNTSSVNFTYDKDGLITQAGDETITRSATTGLISGAILGSVNDTLTYDSTYGELSAYTSTYVPSSGPTTVLLDQSFTRNALSRITNLSDTVNGMTNAYVYTYDSAGRLTDVTKNGSAYSHYVYDSNSNRTSGNTGGVTLTATYDAQDRLSTYNTKTYSYNLNGERLTTVDSSLPSGAQTTTYTYDSFGNLKQVVTPSQTISYKVDALNRRQSKKVGSTVQAQYLYEDQYRVGAILDSSGNLAFRFVYGSKSNVPDYMIKAGTSYRILSDQNGSVRLVVDASTGSIAQQINYDEFGNVISDTSPGFQPFGFAGGLYDPETGLTHFGARDYDAAVGRWLQKDPILFAGGDANLYGYVLQDPINFVDQWGLTQQQVDQAVQWLRGNMSFLFNGINPTVQDSSLPRMLGAVGFTPSQSLILIDSELVNSLATDPKVQMSVLVEEVAHELMHAQIGNPFANAFTNFEIGSHDKIKKFSPLVSKYYFNQNKCSK